MVADLLHGKRLVLLEVHKADCPTANTRSINMNFFYNRLSSHSANSKRSQLDWIHLLVYLTTVEDVLISIMHNLGAFFIFKIPTMDRIENERTTILGLRRKS